MEKVLAGEVKALSSFEFIVQSLTAGGLIFVILWLLKKIFSMPPPPQPKPVEQKPVVRRAYSVQELREYDGRDPSKPILLAAKGTVFDVSRGRTFYGPDGPYGLFAGRDASRALAKNSLEQKDLDNADLEDLTPDERESLNGWVENYKWKYIDVGWLVTEEGKKAEEKKSRKRILRKIARLMVY